MIDLFSTPPRELAIEELHAATAIYTAEPVVDSLLDAIDWPRGDRRLVDPSCGDGIFLGRALLRLLQQRPDISDQDLCNVIEGWELHPVAAAQSRARLTDVLEEHGRPRTVALALAQRIVHNKDFLTEGPSEPRFHCCAGNPPYLRFVNVPEILRTDYLASLPAHACSDLLHSFLDRCAACLMPDGEVALVTADRWLFNESAARLRAELGRRLGIHELRRLDVSTCFYRPKDRRAGTPPRIHPVAVVMRAPTPDCIQLTHAPVYPDHQEVATPAGGQTLDDVARVSLAPWLGAEGIFVVDEATARRLPGEFLVPAVDTDDVKDGKLQQPKRFAIRTRPDVAPPQAIMDHLDAQLHRMAERGRRKQRWLPPESWHNRSLDQPVLLVPRIARSLKPILVPAGTLPINHNLSIVAAGDWNLERIEALLCSEAANRWVQAHAARLDNGFYSLTTTLLRKLPVVE